MMHLMQFTINVGFIMVHMLNEGYIAPYTDIEFQLRKYQTYNHIQDKSLQLIFKGKVLTTTKQVKQMALSLI